VYVDAAFSRIVWVRHLAAYFKTRLENASTLSALESDSECRCAF
jgi:hypothetical protein